MYKIISCQKKKKLTKACAVFLRFGRTQPFMYAQFFSMFRESIGSSQYQYKISWGVKSPNFWRCICVLWLVASEGEHFGNVCTRQQPAGHWLVLVSRGGCLLVGHGKDSWQIIVRRARERERERQTELERGLSQRSRASQNHLQLILLTTCNFCASTGPLCETQPLFTFYIYYSRCSAVSVSTIRKFC